jgi:hypothetical protein
MRFAWLVLLIGCKDLPNVAHDTCGNAVVEPDIGEDCDLFSDPALGEDTACGAAGTTQACRYLCDRDGMPACPVGWGCGGDGVCRYPSGGWEPMGEVDVPSGALLEMADVDGNGALDVLTADSGTLQVAFNLGGTLEVGTGVPLPGVRGPLGLGDVDDDGRADVVVPTGNEEDDEGGLLVYLGQEDRTLAPLAFSPYRIEPPVGGMRLLPVRVDARLEGDAILLLASDTMTFAMFFLSDSTAAAAIRPELAGRLASDLAGRIPVGDVDGDGSEEIALAFTGADRVFVYTMLTVDCTPGASTACMWCDSNMECYDEIPTLAATIAVPVPIRRGAQFADSDGDGDLDLLVSVTAAEDIEATLLSELTDTGYQAPIFEARLSPGAPYAADCGDPPGGPRTTVWPPLTAGDLDGDGDADYVTTAGIYLADATSVCQADVDQLFLGWSDATIGDFNHDGVPDVAAVHSALTGVDVYLGNGDGRFVRHVIDTSFPPAKLRVADYDGDLIQDIAFAEERWRAEGEDGESLSIVFGNVEGPPSAPVTMGRFQYLTQIEDAKLQFSIILDGFADLVVQTSSEMGGLGSSSLAILFGTAAGRMVSSFVLQVSDSGEDVPHAAMIGRFTPTDAVPDMAAATTTRLWRVAGSGAGQFNADDVTSRLVDGYGAPEDTIWRVTDVDGDQVDEIVGVSSTGTIVLADPTATDFVVTQFAAGPFTGATGAEIADLDGDGGHDLVAAFADGGVQVWRDFGGSTLPTPVAVSTAAARGVRVAQVDRDRALEIVILGLDGVSVADSDGAGGYGTPTGILSDSCCRLAAGDLDGDGLADLAIGTATRIRLYRSIPSDEVSR